MVFVHGALTDYRSWAPQLLSLSAHQRVVALSLRHHFPERWDGKKGDYSVGTHMEDLALFIEALGVGPVDLVGHSRGGVVAAMLAGKRPDLVRRLVLAEPATFSLLPVPSGPDPRAAGVKQLNERLANVDMEGALEFFVDSVNAPGPWKSTKDDNESGIFFIGPQDGLPAAHPHPFTPPPRLPNCPTARCKPSPRPGLRSM